MVVAPNIKLGVGVVWCVVERLVRRSVVTAASPVFTSADLGFPVGSCLFDAEG